MSIVHSGGRQMEHRLRLYIPIREQTLLPHQIFLLLSTVTHARTRTPIDVTVLTPYQRKTNLWGSTTIQPESHKAKKTINDKKNRERKARQGQKLSEVSPHNHPRSQQSLDKKGEKRIQNISTSCRSKTMQKKGQNQNKINPPKHWR